MLAGSTETIGVWCETFSNGLGNFGNGLDSCMGAYALTLVVDVSYVGLPFDLVAGRFVVGAGGSAVAYVLDEGMGVGCLRDKAGRLSGLCRQGQQHGML